MKGWHFLRESMRLGYGDGRLVTAGSTLSAEGELSICDNGMHASKRIINALQFAPGPFVCRVELTGELIHESDKSVGRTRHVLWMMDVSSVMHEFACLCAEDALSLTVNPDPRSIAAITAKRAWLRGDISDDELNAAWAAAAGAARAAAGDAARAAAWDAARAAQNRRLTSMVVAAHRKG